MQPLQDSDFFLLLWCTALGDVCYFPSRQFPQAHVLGGGISPYGFTSPPAQAGDVLQALADTAHEMGLRVHGLMRPVASRLAPLHWPLDGVHILFNRGWPFVSYEPAVAADFVAEHGENPRLLDAMDRRWWRHKARYVSAFVQQVRRMLDEVGERRGQRLEFSVTVMARVEQCLSLGLDVAPWLAARWVDRLIVHPCWLPNRWLDPAVRADASVTPERIACASGTHIAACRARANGTQSGSLGMWRRCRSWRRRRGGTSACVR